MKLAYYMTLRGLNQVELAKRSGVPQQLISSYINESGQAKFPSVRNLGKLAKALNCTPNDLLDWPTDTPSSHRLQRIIDLYSSLPSGDPRRRAIQVLLGIEDSENNGNGVDGT